MRPLKRRTLTALLAALLWAAPAFAQERPDVSREISPALFVVRDADSTLYIYGTVHALPEHAEWANAAVRAAIVEADEVWTESDIAGQAAERFAADVMLSLETPAAAPLSSRVPQQYRSRLRFVAKQLGGAIDMETFDPWEAALLLMSAGAPGRVAEAGVDNRVVALAQENGKALRWLEAMGVREFEALPESTQVQFLMYVLDGVTRPASDLTRGEAMWAEGDLEGLDAMELAPMRASYPEFYAWIATARNTAWVARLGSELDGAGTDFVAVGAAHLVGPDSIIAMLRARGYGVERVGAPD